MLGFIRRAHSSSATPALARLLENLVAAEGPAALQRSATIANFVPALTNLRLLSSLTSHSAALLADGRLRWQQQQLQPLPLALPLAHGLSTTAARQQDGQQQQTRGAAPGMNPLQAIPAADLGGNPLSAMPQPAKRAREPTATAMLRHAKISPQKLNDFTRLIRRLHVDDAMIQCKASVKKSAKLVFKLLEAARANGVNNHGLDSSRLYVDTAVVGKAKYLKRGWFHGRGRNGLRHKYRSHCTITLRQHEAGPPPRRITRVYAPLLQRSRSK